MKSIAGKENVGEELEEELAKMEKSIEEAAGRMALLLDNSKNSLTGVKLEVNEKVLDSSSALMKAIADLIRKAKTLQEEIVARSKGNILIPSWNAILKLIFLKALPRSRSSTSATTVGQRDCYQPQKRSDLGRNCSCMSTFWCFHSACV